MRHRLQQLIVACSLLLFLAIAVLWIRSHFVPDMAQYYKHRIIDELTYVETQYSFSSANGGFSFGYGYVEFTSRSAAEAAKNRLQSRYTFDDTFRLSWFHPGWRRYGGMIGDHGFRLRTLGFQYRGGDTRDTRRFMSGQPLHIWRGYTFPYALPFVLFGLLPLLALRKTLWTRQIARRREQGLCLHCGYDLRESKSACPECGRAISQAQGAATVHQQPETTTP